MRRTEIPLRKVSFWKLALTASLLVFGVQTAWSQNQLCQGTLHFKAPSGWGFPYVGGFNVNQLKRMTSNAATGYYDYELDNLGIKDKLFFAIGNRMTPAGSTIVTAKGFGIQPSNGKDDANWPTNDADIPCPGAGNEVWVLEDPKNPGKTIISNTEPDIKYFYVLVPDDEGWKATVPMWSPDGTYESRQPLKVDPDMCGWYYAVWMDEPMPEQFIILKDDDELLEDPIGVDGWGEPLTPFPMNVFFDAYTSNKIYFIADPEKVEELLLTSSISEVDPQVDGNCSYELAAFLYDTDASLHGAFTCDAYPVEGSNGCYVATAKYNFPGNGQAATVPCIGVTPGIVSDLLDPATKKPTYNASSGCFVSAEAFNVMFTETPGVNVAHCRNVKFDLAKDGMWEYDSYNEPSGAFTILNDVVCDPGDATCKAASTPRPGKGNVAYGVGESAGAGNTKNNVSAAATRKLGQVYDWSAIEPNSGLPYIDLYPVTAGEFASGTYPNVYDNSTWDARIEGMNNQMFCFESHANFTYRAGMQFMFRGDDDIWVYIDNKLAVDLGGTHLAAPGFVNLDEFAGASGALVAGNTYDIDIFFCDRRTDMSNVRIKTNMYIQQKTAISAKGKKAAGNPAETDYTLCFTKTGDGSCAAAAAGIGSGSQTYCGAEILQAGYVPSYTLVNGRKYGENVVLGFDNVSQAAVYKCGIDLTDLSFPKVDKQKTCLPGGFYTLFVTIDGKTQKVMSFKTTGEVDVLYKNGNAISVDDETGEITQKGHYELQESAMGGERVPVYISNVAPPTEGSTSEELEVFPDDAIDMTYTLEHDPLLQVYERTVDPATGAETYTRIRLGTQRKIGASGVDTVYVTVPMADLQLPITPFKINVQGRENGQTIYFYLPQITFIESIPEPGETPTSVRGQTAKADGSFDEYWVGSIYDMYLAIVRPNPDGSYSPCIEECNGLTIHAGVGDGKTSPSISFIPEETMFVNGYATISINALVEYRWDLDPAYNHPAKIVAEYNDYVFADYYPMYFRNPPVPFPKFADVFDTKGAVPTLEHKIPDPYFSMTTEYLDGIGDSVAIYYDRRIHHDSLPTRVCVMWDSTVATEHNPYEEGYSNDPSDKSIFCNELVSVDLNNIDCSMAREDSLYCSNVIMIGGLTLSEGVKTAGVGRVFSYAEFEDKGKKMKRGYKGAVIDRIAPVPLRAEVRTLKNGDQLTDYDSLVVIMSEPVKLVTSSNRKTALDFYLNSAIELSDASRYVSALGGAAAVVTAQNDPALGSDEKTGEGRIKYMYQRGSVSPHVGDYVRMGGDLTTVFWSDTTNIVPQGTDAETLRAVADASYYWNSPTPYNETKRTPSPWVAVTGDAEIAVNENKFASTSNAPAGEKVPPVTVHGYRTTMTKAEILAAENGKPGHIVKADMYALYNGLSDAERAAVAPQDIYFYYEVEYFTNLGNFVASKKQKIYCDDKKNTEIDPVTGKQIQYFNGGTCIDAGMDRNFFIGWNMRADNGREVGTGAYIVKLKSYVKLGPSGKEAKQESTSVWGVRRSPKPNTDYLKQAAK